MHAIARYVTETVLVQVPHQVHSVSLGCRWYFSCYYAKEVLHFPPNRGFAPDEIFTRIVVTNPDSFRRLHVDA